MAWRKHPDIAEAVESPRHLSDNELQARRVLSLAESVPARVWGRDELGLGEMWNSNSVISWLLATAGLSMTEIYPPAGGRAPGWRTGVVLAKTLKPPVKAGQGPSSKDHAYL